MWKMKVAMILIPWFLGVTLSHAEPSTPATNATCPAGCSCATMDLQHLDQVQLVCNVGAIQPETPFYKLPGNNTVRFTLVCDPYYISEFAPRALADLHGLQELLLLRCAFLTLPVDLLPSASKLQNLTIYSPVVSLNIPEGFFLHTPMLEYLEIYYSNLTRLSTGDLCQLEYLRYLDLEGNNFEHLEDIGINMTSCLPALETLNISYNKLQSIDIPLQDIVPNVRTLSLQGNRLTQIDEHFQLQHLSVLDVSHNQLQYIMPPNLKLEVVNLANNAIEKVPPALMSSHLTHLDLRYNRISTLSEHFCQNATKLKNLTLAYNLLDGLEPSVLQGCAMLDSLDLRRNLIKTLNPSQFQSVSSLTLLLLNENEITELTPGTFAGLSSLRTLNLAGNQLDFINSTVWEDTVSLEALILAHNSFHIVPEQLYILESLRVLDLGYNKLLSIEPAEFAGMRNLLVLRLTRNYISYVPRYVFKGAPNLQNLNLASNNISSIEYAAFKGSTDIQNIDLSNNRISEITAVFYPTLKNLLILLLAGNNLTTICKEPMVFPPSLVGLDLSYNQIDYIEGLSFWSNPTLILIDLRFNRLSELTLDKLLVSKSPGNVRSEFQLAGNPLSCECQSTFLKTVLGGATTHSVYIGDYADLTCRVHNGSQYYVKELKPEEFQCEYDRECSNDCDCCMGDSACDCRTYCPPQCVCTSDFGYVCNKVDCRGSGPFHMPQNFPPLTKTLLLSDRLITMLPDNGFQSCPNLRKLGVRNASLNYIESKAFSGLTNLESLDLSINNISTLYVNTFRYLSSLRYLNLEDNQLSTIPRDVFKLRSTLQDLNLRSNNLKYINLDDVLSRLNLKSLHLAGNQWECSCDQGLQFRNDLVEWLPTVADAKQLVCGTIDPELIPSNKTYLSDIPVLSIEYEICVNKSDIVVTDEGLSTNQIVGFSLAILFLLFILVMVVLVIHYRKYLEVWLFSKYGWRINFWSKKIDTVPKKYDAFVSFSHIDLDFVLKELMPQLESPELPYRLCVHYRDWGVGESISTSIAESVENSHRTILLLSDNFMQSEWCNYEFQTAHHQLLRERNRHLIVVLLQDEPPEDMDTDLQLYISTHTYLKRSDPWFWQKLKLAMPALSQEEITRRQNTPTHVQRLVEHQRQQMDRLNYRFQDGTVVHDSDETAI